MSIYLHKYSIFNSLSNLEVSVELNTGQQKKAKFKLLPPDPHFIHSAGELLFKIFSAVYEINSKSVTISSCSLDKAANEILMQLIQNPKLIARIMLILELNNLPLTLQLLEHLLQFAVNHDTFISIVESMSANSLPYPLYDSKDYFYYVYLNRIRLADVIDLDIRIPDGNAIYSIYADWNFEDLVVLKNIEVGAERQDHVERIEVLSRPNGETEVVYFYDKDNPYLPLHGTEEYYDSYESFLAKRYHAILKDQMKKLMQSYKELLQISQITTNVFPAYMHFGMESYIFHDSNSYTSAFSGKVQPDEEELKISDSFGFMSRVIFLRKNSCLSCKVADVIKENLQHNCNAVSSLAANWISCFDRIKYVELINHRLTISAEPAHYKAHKYNSPLLDVAVHPIYQTALTILQSRYPELYKKLEKKLDDFDVMLYLQSFVDNTIDWLYKCISYAVHKDNLKTYSLYRNYIKDIVSDLQLIELWLAAMNKHIQTDGIKQPGHELLMNDLILLSYYFELHTEPDTEIHSLFKSARISFLHQLDILREAALAKILLQLKAIAC